MKEYTLQICGKEVTLRYCAAAESGYERMTGKEITVFLPTFGKDADGNDIVTAKPEARNEDYIYLAMAAIVAHYARKEEDAPITADDILYDATPTEVADLITTLVKARNEWYKVPDVVQKRLDAEKASEDINPNDDNDDAQKNA